MVTAAGNFRYLSILVFYNLIYLKFYFNISAHPNVKLFITHGGLLSTTEAVYYGVPVLMIPIYGDQKLNAQIAVINGYGLDLKYKELNEQRLLKALNELLNNPK